MATAERTLGLIPRPKMREGIWSWVTTVDHKRIGIMYGITAFVFFLIGGLEAAMVRIQLFKPDNHFVTADNFNALFTMHATTMIFLAVMPLLAAFMNFLLPLMIGARDVAFPRLNAFSYWSYLFGAIFINTGWFWLSKQGVPNSGWFGYAPLTGIDPNLGGTPGLGPDFWSIGLFLLGTGTLVSGFNFLVTIFNMRAPGMKLMRMPLFVWTSLVTSVLIIFSFPAITVALLMVIFDRNFAANFFNTAAGANVVFWQHLFWTFGHPEVYILILPAMGIVSEVIPTFSRKPLFGYSVMVFSTALIGFLGFTVWSHHMFAVGMGPVINSIFALTTMAISVPTGVKIFNWLSTSYGGQVRFATPMLWAMGFLSNFTIGGLSGFMHSAAPSDTQQTDTYFIVAHIHYVLIGGSLFGIFAGLYYWWPKMFGRMLDEKLGKYNFWITFIGFNMFAFPFHFLGLMGMPRRIFTYSAGHGDWITFWNRVSTIGVGVLAIGILLFIVNAVRSWKQPITASNDPWDARTIEWSIPSPPPEYNYDQIPVVVDRDHLWALKHPELSHDPEAARNPQFVKDEHGIHMPGQSWMPALLALGNTLMGYGILLQNGTVIEIEVFENSGFTFGTLGWIIFALGVIGTLAGFYGWAFEGDGGYLIEPEGEH